MKGFLNMAKEFKITSLRLAGGLALVLPALLALLCENCCNPFYVFILL